MTFNLFRSCDWWNITMLNIFCEKLEIPSLSIYVPVYDRVGGNGQDIIDKPNSAVRFNQGNLTIICDHSHQSNFANLNNAIPGKTKAVIRRLLAYKEYICVESEVGYIQTTVNGNRLYDSNWRHVYQWHDGLCIYTCIRKSSPNVTDVRLTFWR